MLKKYLSESPLHIFKNLFFQTDHLFLFEINLFQKFN
jgi:hypothetical protein